MNTYTLTWLKESPMIKWKKTAFIWALLLPISVNAASVGLSTSTSKFFYGGGVGLSFGDVDTVSLSPTVGVNLTSKASLGFIFSYVYRKYSYSQGDVTTNDYASTLFTRYQLTPQFFLEADVEHLNNEFVRGDLTTDRRDFDSFLAGGGMRSSLGGNTSASITVLYNFSYSDNDSPYSDPISIRAGIGVGF